MPFSALDGLFYRIVPRTRAAKTLAPAISPEGRFHHSDQPSLYVSIRPDWSCHAIQTYVRDTDPPRVICELRLNALGVLDLRNPDHCKASGLGHRPRPRRHPFASPARKACPPRPGLSPTAPARPVQTG